ncbi:MAG: hypothetical protein H3C30_08830 [Candidatus Hydrogenedentes bacterium]|nr:hypothetical protein [Candidatus Hydrogenedentota bacterium]
MSKTAAQLVQMVSKHAGKVPTGDILQFMHDVQNVCRETAQTQRDVAQLQMQRDLILEQMRLKYAFWHEVFMETFAERRQAIEKSFQVIDVGLEKNDNNLVEQGMRGLATIVSSSPINSAIALANALESGKTIEI